MKDELAVAGGGETGGGEEGIDLDLVMAEIRDEVARRRRAGDFPPSLERELDQAFDRFVPAGSVSSDFTEAVNAADRAAYINVAVPTESQKPGVGEVKRVLRKAMAWYLNYLAQQTTSFATTSVRAIRSLGERVTLVEDRLADWAPEDEDPRDRGAEAADLSEWHPLLFEVLAGQDGRVLHAECGDGALILALHDGGLDAYGVEPRGPLVDAAVAAGAEAWPDEPIAHLRAVADGFLGALVLSGCVDRLALAQQRQLIALAADKLRPGGRLILIGANPAGWSARVPAVEADLAPGRPLHATTWVQLAARRRFEALTVHPGRPSALAAQFDQGALAPLRDVVESLAPGLLDPPWYAVSGRRSD